MILLVCKTCRRGLQVSPGDQRGLMSESESLFGERSEYFPDKYPCAWCDRRMELVPAADPAAIRELEVHDVTPAEAYAAMHGLGLPSERDCTAAAVEKLVADRSIKSVRLRQLRHSHRCIIDELELDDGTRLFLGSSAHGATIYRVMKPESAVERLNHG